jgi:hypothetical protein
MIASLNHAYAVGSVHNIVTSTPITLYMPQVVDACSSSYLKLTMGWSIYGYVNFLLARPRFLAVRYRFAGLVRIQCATYVWLLLFSMVLINLHNCTGYLLFVYLSGVCPCVANVGEQCHDMILIQKIRSVFWWLD